ncbi:hypothetical protein BD626DRAFT_526679 [Schizophyllum amplum]|uniref:Secreted protein n=1 Tax=Schizophyllum amplum TaxID=97359 RepID=A0A550BSC0_9AGAR|nr:hypothetical protein BD626DRAFT_526679 [Auriculariopsis ampla]
MQVRAYALSFIITDLLLQAACRMRTATVAPAPPPLQLLLHARHTKQRVCVASGRAIPLPAPAVHAAERPPLEYLSHRAFAVRYSAIVYSHGFFNLAHGGHASGRGLSTA